MKKTPLLLLLALALASGAPPKHEEAASGDAPCKHPFFPLSTGCYYYSGNDNLTTNWFKADDLCRRFGGHLLTIDDPVEGADVKQYLLNQQVTGLVYIDGHALGDYINFYWQSNLAPLEYTDWGPGEPSAVSSHPCITMNRKYQFQWYSYNCQNYNYTFFCEASSNCVRNN